MEQVGNQVILKTAIGPYEHATPLKDGRVTSPRVKLDHAEVSPVNRAFAPMCNDLAFDVSEMALVTYVLARAMDRPLVGLPVVMMRQPALSMVACLKDSELRTARELEGKVIGVRAYTQTTGVWARGILHDTCGLDLDALRWVTFEPAHVNGYQDPPNVTRAAEAKTLLGMLLGGEIDAALGLEPGAHPDLRPVMSDAADIERAWSEKTGVTPINHMAVVQRAVLERYPWVRDELLGLFEAGRQEALRHSAAPPSYGLEPNRAAIELGARYAYEQHVAPEPYSADDLFGAG